VAADTGGFRGRQGRPLPPRCQTFCNMTLKQHDAGMYTAIKNAINGIELSLSFSHGLKFQVVYFKTPWRHRRRRHRAGGGTCPQISDSRGTGGTTEFMGHLQLYEASPNFWDPKIRQHGMTLGQPNFARWPRVTGIGLSFYRIHHAPRHSEGPKGTKIVIIISMYVCRCQAGIYLGPYNMGQPNKARQYVLQ